MPITLRAGSTELIALPRWKPRVLVVEDDPSCLEGLRRSLHRGYDVAPCRTPLEAIYEFGRKPPALMIIDYLLPHVRGVQLAQLLKSCTACDIPLVLISGHSESAVPMESLDCAFLKKPFATEELLGLLSRLLPSQTPTPDRPAGP